MRHVGNTYACRVLIVYFVEFVIFTAYARPLSSQERNSVMAE